MSVVSCVTIRSQILQRLATTSGHGIEDTALSLLALRNSGADPHALLGTQHRSGAWSALPDIEPLTAFHTALAELSSNKKGKAKNVLLAFSDPRAEDEPALHVPREEPVVLKGDRDTVRSGTGQPGRRHELGERRGTALHGGQHGDGLVEDAHAARVIHILILPSQIPRSMTRRSGRSRSRTVV